MEAKGSGCFGEVEEERLTQTVEGAGITNDRALKNEGKADKALGKLEKKVGKAERKAVKKLVKG